VLGGKYHLREPCRPSWPFPVRESRLLPEFPSCRRRPPFDVSWLDDYVALFAQRLQIIAQRGLHAGFVQLIHDFLFYLSKTAAFVIVLEDLENQEALFCSKNIRQSILLMEKTLSSMGFASSPRL